MMNEIETLKQVVSNLNEAVKELQADVKALMQGDVEAVKEYNRKLDGCWDEAVRRMIEKETV